MLAFTLVSMLVGSAMAEVIDGNGHGHHGHHHKAEPHAVVADSIAGHQTWPEYFAQDFYHATMMPLLCVTILLAFLARPSTNIEIPQGFTKFQLCYLSVWAFCCAADWLQGPYVYALYSAYGFSGHEIAKLFVAGFGSSLIFGCFVGSVTDKFGRKLTCILYCALYIISCLTKHFKNYEILMVGRITGGIATSMLFSAFECWMVSEHSQRNGFSSNLLGYMFGMMYTVFYSSAITAGVVGQFMADSFSFHPISEGSIIYVGGYLGPFDLAIGCLFVGMIMIAAMWGENYGSVNGSGESESLVVKVQKAVRLLMEDRRMLLVCAMVSCFEGAMYAFVFNWTPALDSKEVPPPYGLIFAMFMMACMSGSSAATLIGDNASPTSKLMVAFALGVFAFTVCATSMLTDKSALVTNFAMFSLFEFCVGLYFPSIGVLKSEIVPEEVRSTMYNLYRMPLNAIVVVLLLTSISMATCFKVCACLLLVAFGSVCMVRSAVGTYTKGELESLNKAV